MLKKFRLFSLMLIMLLFINGCRAAQTGTGSSAGITGDNNEAAETLAEIGNLLDQTGDELKEITDEAPAEQKKEELKEITDEASSQQDDKKEAKEEAAQADAEQDDKKEAKEEAAQAGSSDELPEETLIDEEGSYTSKEDVALYLHTYGRLPDNFITKNEARDLGWSGGSLEPYAPGKCIGGTYYGNYEEQLPKKKGRKYYECDIDTLGAKNRGPKRIVYSNDGLIYYTEDHYETFELLYE